MFTVPRYLFDHLPKTAGLAVNHFLRSVLGPRRVSPTVGGLHDQLIARYGHYDVICAHMLFSPGSVLNARYKYLTVLREPLDRAISWLHFASLDVEPSDSNAAERDASRRFLSTKGDFYSPALDGILRNPCTAHFKSLVTHEDNLSPSDARDAALEGLAKYDFIGFQESMQTFIDALCDEFQIPRRALPIVNKTSSRPAVNEISPKMKYRLQDLTAIDSELYQAAKLLVAERDINQPAGGAIQSSRSTKQDSSLDQEPWDWCTCVPENGVQAIFCSVTGPDGSHQVRSGDRVIFDFRVTLKNPVRRLLAGFQICEKENGRMIFGTNTDLLGYNFLNVSTKIAIRFNIKLDLIPGTYVAGMALLDSSSDDQSSKLLGWWNRLIDFQIVPQLLDFHGIARLDSAVQLEELNK
jgi:hypothetical protein